MEECGRGGKSSVVRAYAIHAALQLFLVSVAKRGTPQNKRNLGSAVRYSTEGY